MPLNLKDEGERKHDQVYVRMRAREQAPVNVCVDVGGCEKGGEGGRVTEGTDGSQAV